MSVVKYILVADMASINSSRVIAETNTPHALGIIARKHPKAIPLERNGYGIQFGTPYHYHPLGQSTQVWAEFLRAKEGQHNEGKPMNRYKLTWLDKADERKLVVRANTEVEAWVKAKAPASVHDVSITYMGAILPPPKPTEALTPGNEWWVIDYVIRDTGGVGWVVSQGRSAQEAWCLSSCATTSVSFSDCTFSKLKETT